MLSAIESHHVQMAMETYDSVGGAVYLSVRGTPATHVLVNAGRDYDASTIVGIAHGLATGRTLTAEEIRGGASGAAKVLTRLGFEVRDDSPPAAPRVPGSAAPRRTTSPRASRSAKPARPARVAASDRPVNLCPHCNLSLPATGVCDNCA